MRIILNSILLAATVGISGCATAIHAIVSPGLEAMAGAHVEASATPDDVGAGTSSFRGMSCENLATERTAAEQQVINPNVIEGVSAEFVSKVSGWRVNSIKTVQFEQGCTAEGKAAGNKMQASRTAYFTCMSFGSTTLVSNVFSRVIPNDSAGAADAADVIAGEFNNMTGRTDAICTADDSQSKAASAPARSVADRIIVMNSSTIPPVLQKSAPVAPSQPKVAAAGPSARAVVPVITKSCAMFIAIADRDPIQLGAVAYFELPVNDAPKMQAAHLEFITFMQQKEPGRWAKTFSLERETAEAAPYMQRGTGNLGGFNQVAVMFCGTPELVRTVAPPALPEIKWTPNLK